MKSVLMQHEAINHYKVWSVFNQVTTINVISEKKIKKPQLSTMKSVHVYGTLGRFLRQAECWNDIPVDPFLVLQGVERRHASGTDWRGLLHCWIYCLIHTFCHPETSEQDNFSIACLHLSRNIYEVKRWKERKFCHYPHSVPNPCNKCGCIHSNCQFWCQIITLQLKYQPFQ